MAVRLYETDEPVRYALADGIAMPTLNRPKFGNAQNLQLRAQRWWHHSGKPGADELNAREQEVCIGMCRRWHAIPKPTIAMLHAACIASALMLAWVCDLFVASDDAVFLDPLVRMGEPGVEHFVHAQELNPRIAREYLFVGERMSAEQAYRMGRVNPAVPRERLESKTCALAARIAQQPRWGLALTKQVLNRIEELQDLRAGVDPAFGDHHLAHAHNQAVGGDAIGGQDQRAMAAANKAGVG